MTLAILDADHIVWRCAGSCEPTKIKPFLESKDDALARTDQLMHRILHTLGTDWYEAYISGSGNWRKAIYPEYKANRIGKPIPTWLEDVRTFLFTEWKAQIVNEKEVDDMCGIRLTQETDAICVSLDKDLLTVPGKHYNFVTEKWFVVTPLDAKRRFYKQLITGDASDNIPAFDGKFRHVVPAFVQKLLDPIDTMWHEEDMYEHCLEVYQIEHSDFPASELKDMHRNAKCLYIQTEEGGMWHPPGHLEENKPS